MTSRSFGSGDGDGRIDDLPWATVFDPAANARALSAIQAEGFRAASRIVDQFVRAMGSVSDTAGPADDATAANPGEWERLTRAWWSAAGRLLLRSMPAAGSADRDTVHLDVDNPAPNGALTLELTAPGAADAEVWLHNAGPDDRVDVALRCGDLLGHTGEVIPADAIVLDPAAVPLPRRSGRAVTATVTVAADTRPGVYRGTLLAVGEPDLWLPVVLTVRSRNP